MECLGTVKQLSTLGARDFSSAVSGFFQVFIVTRAKSFAARVWAFESHRTREKPLVPRVAVVVIFSEIWVRNNHMRVT